MLYVLYVLYVQYVQYVLGIVGIVGIIGKMYLTIMVLLIERIVGTVGQGGIVALQSVGGGGLLEGFVGPTLRLRTLLPIMVLPIVRIEGIEGTAKPLIGLLTLLGLPHLV